MTIGILLLILAQLYRISLQLAISNKRRTEKWELAAWGMLMVLGIATVVVAGIWDIAHFQAK